VKIPFGNENGGLFVNPQRKIIYAFGGKGDPPLDTHSGILMVG
jgi:hypothetical protein